MKAKKEPKTKASELEVVDGIFIVEKEENKLIGVNYSVIKLPSI